VKNSALYLTLDSQLVKFGLDKYPLPGINLSIYRDVFVRQLIDSIRRIKYVITIRNQGVKDTRADPTSSSFDPLQASIVFKKKGMIDEAFWLAFLSVHFGKSINTGWRLAQDIYGALGDQYIWNWKHISQNPERFKKWLASNYTRLKEDGISRQFGNHRKYETLKPESNRCTSLVFESYVAWIGPSRNHEAIIQKSKDEAGSDPRAMFQYLYNSMSNVISFGRTAKFDYLTMLAKLGLALIEPGSTFMHGSTGPARGARLLFGGNIKAKIKCKTLEEQLLSLETELSVGDVGMQVLEDALCNWQKNPTKYVHFQG